MFKLKVAEYELSQSDASNTVVVYESCPSSQTVVGTVAPFECLPENGRVVPVHHVILQRRMRVVTRIVVLRSSAGD